MRALVTMCLSALVMSVAGALSAEGEPTQLLDEELITQRYIAERRAEFANCVADLQEKSLSAGLPETIATDVLANVEFLPRVIELDRSQPEFTRTFEQYLSARVTSRRIATGRRMLSKHADLLERLTAEYGVPGQYLVAFWGLETNFGSYLGNTSTLDALATLGCDPRRSRFFTEELFNALRLIEEQGIDPDSMRGSWAGAVGHTQFMPSNYRRYARDGDDDGRIDLWNSEADALTSAANFLQSLGWKREERWGREVRLPSDFDYILTGFSNARPLTQWRSNGVTRANLDKLPEVDIQAAMIVPAGHQGPAFAAYSNFKVIMRWNRSEFYAIAVGHLADRIAGGGGLLTEPPKDTPALSRAVITDVQNKLQSLGFDPNGVDGIFGSGTRSALRAFQASVDLIPDGFLGVETLAALGVVLSSDN